MSILKGARILITGGAGFLGHHLTRKLLADHEPEVVIIFSRGEHAQAAMRAEFNDLRLRFFIGDIRDLDRLRMALRGVNVVIHAAALKRVESCSYDPIEAMRTNVMGTAHVVQACVEAGVARAVFISSDKAAAAATAYGKSKACGESLWIAANAYGGVNGTRFSAVRYGNVAMSQGSVIPLWLECRRRGKPLPVTCPQASRFWFTADGAVELVLETVESMKGGELIVPELPSFTVADLAAAIGGPTVDIGFRGVEKMAEAMVSADEAPWFRKENWRLVNDGTPSGAPAVAYQSDTNPWRLDVDALRVEMAKAGIVLAKELPLAS